MNLLQNQRPNGCVNTALGLTINRIGGAIMADASNSDSVEIWKPVPGWEGLYEVSNMGRVRSLDKTIAATSRWGTPQVYFRAGRVLKLKSDRDGYLGCHFVHSGKTKHYKAHQLVCMAFHGLAPSLRHVVAHGDGVRTNNVPSNLRWATTKENHADRWQHGTAPCGSFHGRALLSEENAREIRAANCSRLDDDFARRFGVKPKTVSRIRLGYSWKHLEVAQ